MSALVNRKQEEAELKLKEFIQTLVRSRKYRGTRDCRSLASQLKKLLDRVDQHVNDPAVGFKLMTYFYKSAEKMMRHCDDSGGYLFPLFTEHAIDIYARYCGELENEKKVATTLIKLMVDKEASEWRQDLPTVAKKSLSLPTIYNMIEKLLADAPEIAPHAEELFFSKDAKNYTIVRELARITLDIDLFVKMERLLWGKKYKAPDVDVAEIHVERGDLDAAQAILEQIPFSDYLPNRATSLLLSVYASKGLREQEIALAQRVLRTSRTVENFERLVQAIGEESRQECIAAEVKDICSSSTPTSEAQSRGDLTFLVDMDLGVEVELYVCDRYSTLDGRLYGTLTHAAKYLRKYEMYLGYTLVLRVLLESILARQAVKGYGAAGDYYVKCALVSGLVEDWQGHETHEDFVARMEAEHKRKTSFWREVEYEWHDERLRQHKRNRSE